MTTPVVRSLPTVERPSESGAVDAVARVADRPPLDRGLRVLAVLAALTYVGMFVVVALARVRYPFELEWMEGGTLDAVRRVAGGHSLYGSPSLRFTPYLYTPLYDYVAAGVGAVVGTSIVTLRAVSIVSALVATTFVGALVRHETADTWAGAIAAGLFLACYRISGAWLDIARVDSLFLALTLAAVFTVRVARRPRTAAFAGVLAGAAVMTKQQAVVVVVGVAVALYTENRARVRTYLASTAATVVVACGVLELTSDGWFHVYAVELLLRHRLAEQQVVNFWADDLWRPLAIAVVLGVAALVTSPRTFAEPAARHSRRFLACFALGCLLAAYTARLHTGGYDNVLLPAYAAVAVLFGVALHRFTGGSTSRTLSRVILVAAVVQLGVLAYDPGAQIPTASDVRNGNEMLATLRALDGRVVSFGHSWYAERAGHAPSAQCAALEDVRRAHLGRTSTRTASQLRDAVRRQQFDAVIVDTPRSLSCVPGDLSRYYEPVMRLSSPWPRTGTRDRPSTVWVPRVTPRAAAAGRGPG